MPFPLLATEPLPEMVTLNAWSCALQPAGNPDRQAPPAEVHERQLGLLDTVPPLPAPAMSRFSVALNVAPTARADALRVTEQADEPAQAPLQPVKTLPLPGAA